MVLNFFLLNLSKPSECGTAGFYLSFMFCPQARRQTRDCTGPAMRVLYSLVQKALDVAVPEAGPRGLVEGAAGLVRQGPLSRLLQIYNNIKRNLKILRKNQKRCKTISIAHAMRSFFMLEKKVVSCKTSLMHAMSDPIVCSALRQN